jgi:hypothetical protein
MGTLRITEAELARDVHAVLAKVQEGAEVACGLRSSTHRRQPSKQKKMMAAKSAAVRPEDPVNRPLQRVSHAYTTKIHRLAMRTAHGEHDRDLVAKRYLQKSLTPLTDLRGS